MQMQRFSSPDTTWTGASSVDVKARQNAFIRSAYGWMFSGLMITALAAMWVAVSPPLQSVLFSSPLVFWGLVIAELGLVFWLSLRIQHMSAGAAASAFFVYSLLNGLTLSAILFAYSLGSIFQAFIVAAGMFGAMSLYGLLTKRDLTSWGSFFFMGLIGILLVGVVNIFVQSEGLSKVFSIVGVFVFVGLTAYDTQKLKAYAMVGGDKATNFAVIGALALYLDFINLFLMLLRLFGGRRD